MIIRKRLSIRVKIKREWTDQNDYSFLNSQSQLACQQVKVLLEKLMTVFSYNLQQV